MHRRCPYNLFHVLKLARRVHYQPRPKIYTQYLYLAISIVSDLRLDKPRRPKLWAVDGGKDRNEPDWGPDEKRALAGAYYLSSW